MARPGALALLLLLVVGAALAATAEARKLKADAAFGAGRLHLVLADVAAAWLGGSAASHTSGIAMLLGQQLSAMSRFTDEL